MTQTVKVNSDSSFEVNFGSYAVNSDLSDPILPADFIASLQNIYDALLNLGGSEVHSEKGSFSEFEHIRKGADVLSNNFGTTVTVADFNWLMAQADAVDLAINPPPPDPSPDQGSVV